MKPMPAPASESLDVDAPHLAYEGRTPYVEYTEADVLRELIHVNTDEPLEVTFVVATQIMELHFALLKHEWTLAIAALDADDVRTAVASLSRSMRVQESLIGSWSILGEMSPVQYNRFRDALGHASGFQSFGYRELEFLLGVKDERMLRPHVQMPRAATELERIFAGPSLYEAAVATLARRGYAVPPAVLARDHREPWTEAEPEVVQAWRTVYADDGELAELAEALVGVAERHSRWRFVHYTAVYRILGAKPGTAGSAGLTWLKRAVDQMVFIDLWAVRGVL
ncbi:MAG: tryptophan 2,3-dioxygenase family protein [bacterium]